jgi:hypothetical protein
VRPQGTKQIADLVSPSDKTTMSSHFSDRRRLIARPLANKERVAETWAGTRRFMEHPRSVVAIIRDATALKLPQR